jgi:hypothetical protein
MLFVVVSSLSIVIAPSLWAASYLIWTLIAFATGCTIYQFNLLFWKSGANFWESLRLPLVNELIYATLTPIVLLLAVRYPLDRTNWRLRVFFYAAGAIAFTTSHALIRMLVHPVIDPMSKQAYPLGFALFGRLFLYNLPDDCFSIYLPVVIIAPMICYYRESRNRELRASQLETRLAQAQLRALKNQLQPHFLFNTLHSISTLMLTNVAAALLAAQRTVHFGEQPRHQRLLALQRSQWPVPDAKLGQDRAQGCGQLHLVTLARQSELDFCREQQHFQRCRQPGLPEPGDAVA